MATREAKKGEPIQMVPGRARTIDASPRDAEGRPVTLYSDVEWAIVGKADVATVEQDEGDPLVAVVVGLKPGTVTLRFRLLDVKGTPHAIDRVVTVAAARDFLFRVTGTANATASVPDIEPYPKVAPDYLRADGAPIFLPRYENGVSVRWPPRPTAFRSIVAVWPGELTGDMPYQTFELEALPTETLAGVSGALGGDFAGTLDAITWTLTGESVRFLVSPGSPPTLSSSFAGALQADFVVVQAGDTELVLTAQNGAADKQGRGEVVTARALIRVLAATDAIFRQTGLHSPP